MPTRSPDRAIHTGAPLPSPVWQMVCEFANGACVCAATRADGPPCHAVEAIAHRIEARAYHDLSLTHDLRRKAKRNA